MKAYLMVTGALFALLTVVHIWRAIEETSVRDPWFFLITLASAALCGWSARLLMADRAESRASS